jgi:putative tryptophan/tyrosine transport system substrate-binding protein
MRTGKVNTGLSGRQAAEVGDPVGACSCYLAALVSRYRIPTIYPPADLARSGGLMSYGAGTLDVFRRAGQYVGKILQGAKPADMPVEQPTKITLKINLRTAKALGLNVPPALLVRADEVIE